MAEKFKHRIVDTEGNVISGVFDAGSEENLSIFLSHHATAGVARPGTRIGIERAEGDSWVEVGPWIDVDDAPSSDGSLMDFR